LNSIGLFKRPPPTWDAYPRLASGTRRRGLHRLVRVQQLATFIFAIHSPTARRLKLARAGEGAKRKEVEKSNDCQIDPSLPSLTVDKASLKSAGNLGELWSLEGPASSNLLQSPLSFIVQYMKFPPLHHREDLFSSWYIVSIEIVFQTELRWTDWAALPKPQSFFVGISASDMDVSD